MKRFALLVIVLLPSLALGLDPASDPALAVVRIKSHGASATIIATSQGKSLILGCCHMFFHPRSDTVDPQALRKPLRIDGPPQPHAPQKTAQARVLLYDAALDLSLLELDNGPFNFIPVAPRGHQPSQTIGSYGYDKMAWPITVRRATLIGSAGSHTYAQEHPGHGRSGGGLIDVQSRVLIGVVQGYELGLSPHNRGLYVSHSAILGFLERYQAGQRSLAQPPAYAAPDTAPHGPALRPDFSPWQSSLPGT
jgi:hypothetical protein